MLSIHYITMKNNQILYRWISSKNIHIWWNYMNLTNDIDFARDYGDIVLVYELCSENILEENTANRQSDVRDYDAIKKYRWL